MWIFGPSKMPPENNPVVERSSIDFNKPGPIECLEDPNWYVMSDFGSHNFTKFQQISFSSVSSVWFNVRNPPATVVYTWTMAKLFQSNVRSLKWIWNKIKILYWTQYRLHSMRNWRKGQWQGCKSAQTKAPVKRIKHFFDHIFVYGLISVVQPCCTNLKKFGHRQII